MARHSPQNGVVIRLAANLTLLYPKLPWLQRPAAAAADGFSAVECLFPYELPASDWRAALQAAGLPLVLFNAPPGDWAAGDRGLAALPARQQEFRRGLLEQALPYAQALGCRQLHVMAGVPTPGTPQALTRQTLIDNLRWAAEQLRPAGITVLVEALNAQDMPGYAVPDQATAQAIVAATGADNAAVQLDLYHVARTEGDVAGALAHWLPGGRVGHIQIAGLPGRHEPDRPPVDGAAALTQIEALGWAGHVGCEYHPRAAVAEGLHWARPWWPGARAAEPTAGRSAAR